jgi:hypothetical protein
MGLVVTHGCWAGPYSQFMRWRSWLHGRLTGGDGSRDADLLLREERGDG